MNGKFDQGKSNLRKREPLSGQSKEILFGFLSAFFFMGAIAAIVLMFLL